jgi:hypothetical protein
MSVLIRDSSNKRMLDLRRSKGSEGSDVRQRLILATTASCALVMLIAIHNGAFDAGAAVVLVAALLLFVRAAFHLVDDVERRDEERAARRERKGRPPA